MEHCGPGTPTAFGATPTPGGCDFSLFSKHATAVELLFFSGAYDPEPEEKIVLDSTLHRTGDVWHIHVPQIRHGQIYGWVVDGPWQPDGPGHRFNRYKLLLDPYAKAVVGGYDWNDSSAYSYEREGPGGDRQMSRNSFWARTPKAVVVDDHYDWERVRSPGRALKDTVIYEAHVRAMTKDESSGVASRGTYRGFQEKIPYLKSLGITAVELLPIHEFNPSENTKTNPETGESLTNFWGYSTVNFFSPCAWFSSDGNGLTAVREFKDLVKALHQAEIEVILDVVYNHSAEGNEFGPTISFRGLDNSIYYSLDQGRHYKNHSGCGNTLNCDHPIVRRLILDSLRHWVVEYHIDGFRFDLAAVLGRGEQGEWIPNYSVLRDISLDPLLARTKIIAEGWDADGLFKVGEFPAGWSEWNAHYRDDIRRLVKSDSGSLSVAATRLAGSSDLFGAANRHPWHSINFITAHDGFTLADLVSYNAKHNWANAEDNRDGNSWNLSWNCGLEGPTRDAHVVALRGQQRRNFLTLLFLSQGTPMLLAGDEFAFSKAGNNNTYCHDSPVNWLDWNLVTEHQHQVELVRTLTGIRGRHSSLRRDAFFSGNGDIVWTNPEGDPADWSPEARSLAILFAGEGREPRLWVALNFHWEPCRFLTPEAGLGAQWKTLVRTENPTKTDEKTERTPTLAGRSILVAEEVAIHS